MSDYSGSKLLWLQKYSNNVHDSNSTATLLGRKIKFYNFKKESECKERKKIKYHYVLLGICS